MRVKSRCCIAFFGVVVQMSGIADCRLEKGENVTNDIIMKTASRRLRTEMKDEQNMTKGPSIVCQ
jgi:hypothetical protein